METKVIKVSEEALKEAVRVLESGLPVVYPTETFYGLGADPYNEEAIKMIFEAKGRKEDKPLSLIVRDLDMAGKLVSEFPPWAMDLVGAFWPGPLTLVLRAARGLSLSLIHISEPTRPY